MSQISLLLQGRDGTATAGNEGLALSGSSDFCRNLIPLGVRLGRETEGRGMGWGIFTSLKLLVPFRVAPGHLLFSAEVGHLPHAVN